MQGTSGSADRRALPRVASLAAFAACVCGVLLWVSAAPAAASTYTMTDLGSLGGGLTSAYGINNNGQITGVSETTKKFKVMCFDPTLKPPCFVDDQHAFLWSNGVMRDLGSLGGSESVGQAINNSGEVAGWSYIGDGNSEDGGTTHAFTHLNGQMTDLGTLLPGGVSRASAINDSGAVAGASTPVGSGSPFHAFLDVGGKMTDLGLIPGEGGTFTAAAGINNAGQIVGTGDTAGSDSRAWLYSNGQMTDLGTLGGPNASASAINNSGQIVGVSQTSTDATHAFLYSGGMMTDLGPDIQPDAINDSGVIVGEGTSGNTGGHAVIDSGGVIQDLNSLVPAGSGFTLIDATGINKTGQIIANATHGQAFLLTPN
jgi:probable HAF family extracellular repeat protein